MSAFSELILKVEAFAAKAHNGQTRRYSDQPYVVHPLSVMKRCGQYTNDVAILCAALLHDVLEDTAVAATELESFLRSVTDEITASKTFNLVVELTDVYTKESHPNLNRARRKELETQRLATISGDAQTIKYADIIDNADVAEHDPGFARKYLREQRNILAVMTYGNASLRTQALDIIDHLLSSIANYHQNL
jgi:guanosine-3',5'-bis(diphosphate) 3'-pyrophosphohydrolase